MAKKLYSTDAFEQQKLLLEELSKPVIFDVGAYVGDVSKKYLSLFPDALIYAFEPFEDSYKKLKSNVKKIKNININNIALSDRIGKAGFNVNEFSPTNSLLESSEKGQHYWGKDLLDTRKVVKVKTTTIDEFSSKKAIPRIDILKLDTQGTEYMILEGARTMLNNNAISLIYMEIILVETYKGQRLLPEITDLLATSGYRLFGIYNPRISKTYDLNQVDAIFIPYGVSIEE